MNYTEGEWKYKKVNENHWIICYHLGYKCVIAEITENIPEMEANAYLIAAAPDIYEACLSVNKWLEALINTGYAQHPLFQPMKNVLGKALSKAEGK